MPSYTQQKQLSREERKKRDNTSPSFSWPDYIIYQGKQVFASEKCPTFARFMISSGQMNRTIIVSRDQYLRHLRDTGFYD